MAASEQIILWAEDDDNDALLLGRAVRKARLGGSLIRVHDGEEAIQYLTGQGCYADRAKYPLPSLLLLDVKMPRKNGFDVLQWKKSQPQLQALPTVMFSSSPADGDVQTAQRLGAGRYIVKPSKPEDMVGVVQCLMG